MGLRDACNTHTHTTDQPFVDSFVSRPCFHVLRGQGCPQPGLCPPESCFVFRSNLYLKARVIPDDEQTKANNGGKKQQQNGGGGGAKRGRHGDRRVSSVALWAERRAPERATRVRFPGRAGKVGWESKLF